MKTMRHDRPGPFPVEPGTCLMNPNLPMADGTQSTRPNWHPFIVIGKDTRKDGTEFVTMLMGRTLYDANDGKDRSWKLGRIPGAVEIKDPCPPMDRPERRGQYTDTSQIIEIDIRELFKGGTETAAVYGDKLSAEQTKTLADKAAEQSLKPYASRTRIEHLPDTFQPPKDRPKRTVPRHAVPRQFEELAESTRAADPEAAYPEH